MLVLEELDMSKKPSLAAALQQVTGKPQVLEAQSEEISSVGVQEITESRSDIPPSRQGKKAVSGYFDPAVSKQLKQIMLDNDKTLQLLLAEALNDLFVKYGKKPIA
jgi:hypothetical protein